MYGPTAYGTACNGKYILYVYVLRNYFSYLQSCSVNKIFTFSPCTKLCAESISVLNRTAYGTDPLHL